VADAKANLLKIFTEISSTLFEICKNFVQLSHSSLTSPLTSHHLLGESFSGNLGNIIATHVDSCNIIRHHDWSFLYI